MKYFLVIVEWKGDGQEENMGMKTRIGRQADEDVQLLRSFSPSRIPSPSRAAISSARLLASRRVPYMAPAWLETWPAVWSAAGSTGGRDVGKETKKKVGNHGDWACMIMHSAWSFGTRMGTDMSC